MNFAKFDNSFCPILSIGGDEPLECQKNCEWFNPITKMCDVSTIAGVLTKDPDIAEALELQEEPEDWAVQ